MRLGGPTFRAHAGPADWVAELLHKRYRAAYCPLKPDADAATVRAYADAARDADIVIAEVGAWSNLIAPDPVQRSAAIEKNKACLALADAIGARCCVNYAGTRGQSAYGPDPRNLTPETFDMIVATVREIIDAVAPTRSAYALEMMPWAYPESPDSYVRLINAIDRPAMAVHLDPVNIITSVERYYDTAALIRECFAKLAPWLRSCHAKDIIIRERLTFHVDETAPGQGALHYPTFITELNRLDPDIPLMMEHLGTEAEYDAAAAFIRSIA